MRIQAKNVQDYLSQLPDDRREALEAIRKIIAKNIDKPFEEGLQYGMPSYYLPHSYYPAGYHCDPKQPLPFAAVASQKNHIGLYLFCVYTDEETLEWFVTEWKKTGKRLDMGKSCIRVKKLDDIPLDLLGKLFKRIKAKKFVAAYEARFGANASKPASKKKPAKKKAVKKKPTSTKKKVSKKPAAKKPAAKKKGTKKKVAKKPAAKKASTKAKKKTASKRAKK